MDAIVRNFVETTDRRSVWFTDRTKRRHSYLYTGYTEKARRDTQAYNRVQVCTVPANAYFERGNRFVGCVNRVLILCELLYAADIIYTDRYRPRIDRYKLLEKYFSSVDVLKKILALCVMRAGILLPPAIQQFITLPYTP